MQPSLRALVLALVSVFAMGMTIALPAAAQGLPRHMDAQLLAKSSQPSPGGKTRVALKMTPQPGWHGYWTNPGDSGLSVEVEWKLPAGVRIGTLEHPAPTRLDLAGFSSYVHESSYTLLGDLTVDRSVVPGTALPIRAEASWLVCSDELCVPGHASLALNLVAGEGGADRSAVQTFARAEAALPVRLKQAGVYAVEGAKLRLEFSGVKALDTRKARLYPATDGWFGASAQQTVAFKDGIARVAVVRNAVPKGQFSGVLSDGRHAYSVSARAGAISALPVAAEPLAPEPGADTMAQDRLVANPAISTRPGQDRPVRTEKARSASSMALWIALGGAILGGLLLNLMPCVFPILSLKALSLARSGADRRTAQIEGVAYMGGSVLTALALGGALIFARAMGQDIGWSFQLQDPRAILVLMLLSLAIALNLAGLFDVRGPSLSGGIIARQGWLGAFGTGALAALIATPCSGPFMGAALGAALVLPPLAALAIFAGLGFGMALPFLLIAFIPGIQRRLPRPGAWMETFRRLLAIPMLLTTIALAWVLGRQTGVDGLTIGLLVAALGGLGLWWLGLRQVGQRSGHVALVPIMAALVLAVAIDLPRPAAAVAAQATGNREPFSEARLAELRQQGTPVFVDFTADWCLTCKVNERVAINRDETQAAFKAAGVVTLVGDWTTGDPAITRFLAQHGRNSIPYYLYVAPGKSPEELPQILSPGLLTELVG